MPWPRQRIYDVRHSCVISATLAVLRPRVPDLDRLSATEARILFKVTCSRSERADCHCHGSVSRRRHCGGRRSRAEPTVARPTACLVHNGSRRTIRSRGGGHITSIDSSVNAALPDKPKPPRTVNRAEKVFIDVRRCRNSRHRDSYNKVSGGQTIMRQRQQPHGKHVFCSCYFRTERNGSEARSLVLGHRFVLSLARTLLKRLEQGSRSHLVFQRESNGRTV